MSELKTLGIDSASIDAAEMRALEVDGLKIAVAVRHAGDVLEVEV